MKVKMTLLMLFLMSTVGLTTIRTVPGGYRTIPEAMSACQSGDTVVVSRGEHVVSDSIVFSRDNITLTSRFMFDRDPRTVEATTITGTWNKGIVSITRDARLMGFTIIRGRSTPGGGGVRVSGGDVVLEHLIVDGNLSLGGNGGGIYITGNGETTLRDVIVKDNVAPRDGGGIYCNSSDLIMERVTLFQNNADDDGGGLYIDGSCNVNSTRLLVYGNGADRGGGIFLSSSSSSVYDRTTLLYNASDNDASGGIHVDDGDVTLVNSIIWQNGVRTIYAPNGYRDDLDILYCNILGGEEDIEAPGNYLNWGEGNIDRNPMFINQQEDDYRVRDNSPCVDAGDPESSPDPDGTTADIGYYSTYQTATLYGYLMDAQTGQPVGGRVTTFYESNTQSTESNESGFWRITEATVGDFSITASAFAYNDSTKFDFSVEPDQQLQVDTIFLLHPEFEMDLEDVGEAIDPGDSVTVPFSLSNNGNGPLYWTVDKQITGDAGVEPWTELNNFAAGDSLGDDRLAGVALVGDYYYIAGGSPDEEDGIVDSTDYNYVYVLDREGTPVDYFRQWGTSAYGMTDLAYDGELLWAGDRGIIYGFTTDGDSVTSFDGPERSQQGLAWDPDRELFWACAQLSDISAVDREGNVIHEVDRFGLRIRGLAYFPDDPDGYPLYVFHREDNEQKVYKIDPTANDGDGDTLLVAEPFVVNGRGPESAFITSEYDDVGSWVFMGITNVLASDGNDKLLAYHLQSFSGWIQLVPFPSMVDTLNAGEELDFNLYLNTNDPNGRFILPEQLYEAEITFTHNAEGIQHFIPITMNVRVNSVFDDESSIPDDFAITSIYPNPFNSTAVVQFTLPQREQVTLELYDIHGRLVSLLEDNTFSAGNHQTHISADSFSSGIYFVKLTSSNSISTKKLVLMK